MTVSETCLWVLDASRKQRRWVAPESLRCHPGSRVFCRPCLDRLAQPAEETQR